MILDPIPDEYPDPDCPHCGGEGAPSLRQRVLAESYSYPACPHCYEDEEDADHD